jgi:hypothetical protein
LVLTEVLVTALKVEVALRRRPFARVLAQTAQIPPAEWWGGEIPNSTLLRAIRVAYRVLPIDATCLKQSLVFCRVRRRHGLPAELRIGVQKREGAFAAHAWVEDDAGNVLTDPQEGFSPLTLSSAPTRGDRASG